MATSRTWRAPSRATRPWACRRSSWRTSARRSAAATWRARTSSTPTPWRRSCARRWRRAAAPTSSSSPAPTPAPFTASTRRCAAAKSISRRAPTARSSRRRNRSTSSPGSGGRFTACRSSRTWWRAAGGRWLAAGGLAGGEEAKPESSRVRLAVGGKRALFYLPLTVTERLGYFRDAGLEVEISDFPGGARALQALIGGSADVVTGAYDPTIQMQAKNQPIVALVQAGEFPRYVLAGLPGQTPGAPPPPP